MLERWGCASPRFCALATTLIVLALPPTILGQASGEQAAVPATTHALEDRLNPYSDQWDNSIVICTIMRKEYIEDIREWLQYHRYIGVDHVLLHDNNEDGGQLAQPLRDFVDDGFVTVIQVQGEARQLPVYDHCARRLARHWAWMIAMDVDEFLHVSDPDAQGTRHPLKQVLASMRFRPGVFVQWRVFGPDVHEARPTPGGPMKHYKQCVPKYHMNTLGKTIANTYWLHSGSSAHCFFFRDSAFATNDFAWPLPPMYSKPLNALADVFIQLSTRIADAPYGARLVMHHYMTRSREDFELKRERGGGARARNITFRSMGWFDEMRTKLQKIDPICEPLAKVADACCYRNGRPWPPIPPPAAVLPPSLRLPESKLIPAVMDARNTMRMPYPQEPLDPPLQHLNPFYHLWPGTIAVCVLMQHDFEEMQLRRWLLHHKHIGVDKFVLYASDPEEGGPIAKKLLSMKQMMQGIVGTGHVSVRRVLAGTPKQARAELRRQCMVQQHSNSWIVPMDLEEHLMVLGPDKATPGRLKSALRSWPFRMGPGVVLHTVDFERGDRQQMPKLGVPLQWYDRCSSAPPTETLTIINSHYLVNVTDTGDFRYRGDQLPLTAARSQWIYAAKDWDIPGVGSKLKWGEGVHPEGVTPDVTSGEAKLRVFRMPPSGAPAHAPRAGDTALDDTASDECREAIAAHRAIPKLPARPPGARKPVPRAGG